MRNPTDGSTNLGFYRALVAGERELVLFMDPRTHAYRICEEGLAASLEVPITLFNGGPLSTYLAAAAKLPYDFDSFEAAARLSGRSISIDRTAFPPAPADAEIVLRGFVTRQRRDEAPFGEFKGYYCPRTRSPLVRIERVLIRDDASYLGLFCGKESGLTLMALQNEILMLAHLRGAGFPIVSVRYPLAMFGEYAAIIVSTDPSREMVRAAMEFDPRAKVVVAMESDGDVFRETAVFPAEADLLPYMRRGHQEGHRLGLLCRRATDYDWVEY
jgi:4-hydroxy-3-polyprenylbenzoate decarboxylase